MEMGAAGRDVRVGVIGLGGRGFGQMQLLASMPDVKITSVCDLYEDRVKRSGDYLAEAFSARPFETTDYREVLKREDVETVIIMTSWQTHILIAVDAMKQGIIPALEVGGASSVDECWQLVRTSEATGIPCMLLENCCYGKEDRKSVV